MKNFFSPRRLKPVLIVSATLSVCATSLAQLGPPPGPPAPPAPIPVVNTLAGFGAPLPGLSRPQIEAFNAGLAEFVALETPEGGLGPIFNGRSCVECHSAGAAGGASNVLVTRFGRTVDGQFDPLESQGGSLLQRFAINPQLRETIPHEANVIAQRQSTPLFGLGLIEAIPDGAILANALAVKADGVKGRAAIVTDITTGQPRVGRLGWKAQQATLLAFSADAYLNEMGITNRFLPKENAPNGNEELLARFKTTPDPEDEIDPVTVKGDIDVVADFMRYLAPPPRAAITLQAAAGESLFLQSGCAVCHTPALRTGPNPVAALDRKTVNLYSDLLLHDMGTLNDGIAQADAGAREMKTPPLWGLRASAPYLHDGRATTVDAAIRAHDGEGAPSRERYVRLPNALRQQLLAFLGTL